MKHLILLCLLFGIFGHIEAQIRSPINEPEIPINFDECKAKDYKFKAQNNLFNDGDKIRFCPSSLPDTIELVDLMGNPVSFSVMWIGAKVNTANTYSCIIDNTNFANGVDIIAEFMDVDGMQKLKLKNKGKAAVKLENDGSSLFAYDDNMKMDYPSYNTTPQKGIPWKFLESSKMESIEAKASGSYQPIFFQANNNTLSISPANISGKKQVIQLNHPATLGDSTSTIDINGCSTDAELKVFVGDAINKTVNFVYLCDSLGNCPPNLDIPKLVKEANEVLNEGGLNITIKDILYDTFRVMTTTEITDKEVEIDTFEIRMRDSTYFDTDTVIIENGDTTQIIGDSVTLIISDTIQTTVTQIVKDTVVIRDRLSEVFAERLASGLLSINVQGNLHHRKYLGSPFFTSDYLVMIAQDLGETVDKNGDKSIRRGRATEIGQINSLALDAQDISDGTTLAHEIGHACFGLSHPKNRNPSVCDTNNFMFFTKNNPVSPCNGVRINNIRAYQLFKIHKIR